MPNTEPDGTDLTAQFRGELERAALQLDREDEALLFQMWVAHLRLRHVLRGAPIAEADAPLPQHPLAAETAEPDAS